MPKIYLGKPPWVSGDDTYPVLAHSSYSNTWPQRISPITGQLESFWPGSWSQDFNINLPGCSQSRKDRIAGRKFQGGLFLIWMCIWSSMTGGPMDKQCKY